jgi:hypothetical protein
VDVVAVRRRQVHDLPEIPAPVVTEYRADVTCCPGCRGEAAGEFPAGVNAPTQYGPEITTRVADVVVGHHVPVHRSTVLVMELLDIQVSTGFAAGLLGRAAAAIRDGGFLAAVKNLLATAPVVHADESFARAASGTAFVHGCLHRAPDLDAHRGPVRRHHQRRRRAARTESVAGPGPRRIRRVHPPDQRPTRLMRSPSTS